MPLSDFLWSVQTPSGHGIGGKRKVSGDANSSEALIQNSKRRCLVVTEHGDDGMDDENHNQMISQNLNNTCHMTQGQQQLSCPGFLSPNHSNHLPQPQELHQNNVFISQSQQVASNMQGFPQEHFVQKNEMIMDLNDEVFSNATLPTEEDMACSTMESDCVPDPQQYSSRYIEPQLSVAGETTAVAERVKCYCRPSWEGILEMKPYVSDYY